MIKLIKETHQMNLDWQPDDKSPAQANYNK